MDCRFYADELYFYHVDSIDNYYFIHRYTIKNGEIDYTRYDPIYSTNIGHVRMFSTTQYAIRDESGHTVIDKERCIYFPLDRFPSYNSSRYIRTENNKILISSRESKNLSGYFRISTI